jgi:hypothetical protein
MPNDAHFFFYNREKERYISIYVYIKCLLQRRKDKAHGNLGENSGFGLAMGLRIRLSKKMRTNNPASWAHFQV